MNKSQIQGTLDELVGGAKRKTGELTGDKTLQVKGIAQQTKGTVEKAWGKTKEHVSAAIAENEVHMDAHVKLAAKNSSASGSIKTVKSAAYSKPPVRTV